MALLNLYSNDDINLVEEEFGYYATIPLLEGFRFIGWTLDKTTQDETEEDSIAAYEATDGERYLPVFLNNFVDYPLSTDEFEREQIDINKGKNAVVFVHGSEYISYLKRYTTKELKYIDFSFFDDNDMYEGYLFRN